MPRTIGAQRLQILALLLAAVSSDQLGASAEDPNIVERFKVETDGNALLVPVTVSGKEYLFLVDTGTTVTQFDRTLLTGKPKHETEIRDDMAGDCSMPLYDVPTATLGRQDLKEQLSKPPSPTDWPMSYGWIDPRDESGIHGYDFSRFREVSGREIYGLIGMDFLHNFALQIDFDKGELLLLRKASSPRDADSFKLYYDELGRPLVSCGICDWGEAHFLIDTGCMDTGRLESELAKGLIQAKMARRGGSTRYASFCREGTYDEVLLASFAMGSHETVNLTLTEGGTSCLGLEYLSRFIVTFDFPSKLLYVTEGKAFGRRDGRSLSGLHLVRKNGRIIVDLIDADSPAERSGLNTGDTLLTIDERDVSKTSLDDLRRVFRQERGMVHVTAEREGKQITAAVKLE
jgi:hypothetical protein